MRYVFALSMLAAIVLAPWQARAGDAIVVCVKGDGILRLGNGPCGPGETKRLFAEWEPDTEDSPEDDEAEQKQSPSRKDFQELSKRVAALENAKARDPMPDRTQALNVEALAERVSALESRRAGNRVTAPFEVVGRGGTVILRVAERVSSNSGNGAHVTIGGGESGNYGVRIHNKGGPLAAGIGQSREGTGVVVVMDAAGVLAANMNGGARKISVFDGEHAAASMAAESGGTIAVYDGTQPVAYLTRSSHGKGGNVTLATSEGFGVFSAGAASDGGGEACLNRVTGGGKQRNVCLGVELPSMGLGK